MKPGILLFIAILASTEIFAQAPPVITEVRPGISYPGGIIEIEGSGFSENSNELSVRFGAVEGEIISSYETIIQVRVPISAEAQNITVIHKANRLSAKSKIIFFPNYSGGDFSVDNFSDPQQFTENLQLFDVCACDFNADGKPDLAVSKLDGATNSVRIYMNESTPGNINFTTSTSNPPIIAPTADLKCGDLNGDGWPELIATKGGTGGVDRNAIYYFENVSGTLSGAKALNLPAADVTTENVTIKDLNFDGKPDLIVSNSKTNIIYAFQNTSENSISFNTQPLIIQLEGREATRGLELQDLNGDKRPDIIVAAQSGLISDIVVLRNESTANILSFGAPQTYQIGEVLQGEVIAADFNSDGLLDLAAASPFSNKLILLRNESAGDIIDFDSPNTLPTGGIFGLDIADINGDGKIDLIGTDTKNNYIPVFINASTSGQLVFNLQQIPTDFPTRNVSSNDFDGDGKPDIAYTAEGNNAFYLEIIRNSNCYQPVLLGETPQKICPTQEIPVNVIPSPGSTFTWFLDGVEVGTTTESTFTNVGTGTLTVSVSQEGGSCVNTSENSLVFEDGTGSIPGEPTASTSGTACIGEDITLIATEVTGAEYSWTGPAGFTSVEQNPVLTNMTEDMAGIYSLSITLGDCQSSVVTTAAEVFVFPTFVIESSAGDGFCEGSASTLSVNSLAEYSYEWFDASGSIGTGASTEINSAGEYHVRITNNTYSCVLDVEPINIVTTTIPDVSFTASKETICAGESVSFTNNTTFNAGRNIQYTWDFGDGNTSAEVEPSHMYAALGTYTVSLTADYEGVSDCSSVSTVQVTVTDATVPSISAPETAICEGEEELDLTLNINFQSIEWNTGETTQTITVETAGLYSVETLDENGCPGNADITIEGLEKPEITVLRDTTVNVGDTVRLFASGADTYEWSTVEGPDNTLDDPFSDNPLAETGETTMYQIVGFSTDFCTDTAYVTVTIDPSGVINVQPNAFLSPATVDGINDTWIIDKIRWYSECSVTIFDRRGVPVFETTGYNNEWDGTRNGSELPEGVYYYMIACPNSPDLIPKKGTVLLVK